MTHEVVVVGAGLAGCECALTLARSGVSVVLFEQKPENRSEAHVSNLCAELVCSNSLRSAALTSGVGLLKQEMRELGSPFMAAADRARVPADKALAVDRTLFSSLLSQWVEEEPKITLVREQVRDLDGLKARVPQAAAYVLAVGPLASEDITVQLERKIGAGHCYFYDAIAPILWTHSLDLSVVFRASRYECDTEGFVPTAGVGDYLNCPLNRDEYARFYAELCRAATVPAKNFEQLVHFEGCMPIEALAARGERTLVFGPFKPVGFLDPRTGKRPYAVVQLRSETVAGDTCNVVGCQTRMRQSEQERVFRLIPGLERAEFVRFGSMHRNTYVHAPKVLNADLSLKADPQIFLAGQITGVEGYVESAACGLWVGLALARRLSARPLAKPPRETALGALLGHLETPAKQFQPSNVHFGLMPPPAERMRKKDRKEAYAGRAREAFALWRREQSLPLP